MARIELNYGRGTVPFEFEDGRFELLDGEASDERPLTDAEVGALIDDPFDSQPLEEIISPGETILIVVSDATRATGSAQVVNLLVRRLIAVGFHYFAGFTGGRKSVCPGLASRRTIEATHLHALDFERGGRRAGVGAGRLDGNAVHEECERIAAEAAPSFLINTVVDERGRVVRLYAGDWRAAHRRACAEYANSHTIKIKERRALVVASAGGLPHDINLIQAHKALEMASYACEEGGHIVLVAEYADGLGRADFLKWFDAADSRALESRLRASYEVSGQTAWSLLTKAERFRVQLVSTLPDEDVRLMRMTPARTLADALAHVGSGEGYIMPRGAALMPVPTPQDSRP